MLLQRSLRVVTRTSFVKARQSHSQGRVFACQLHVDVIDVADSRSKSVSEISELLQQELRGTHKTGPPVLQLERQRFDDLPPPLYARHGSETRAILAMSDAQDATQQRNFRKTLAALSKEAEPSHTVSVVGNLREAGDFLEDALVGNSQQKHTCTIRYLGVSVQPQLTVVCGPMFAGKTNRLVDFYEQAASALCANVALGATSQPLKIQVLKPALDNRDAANVVRTHDGRVIDHAISYQSLDFERDFCECGDATRNPVVRSDCPDVFIIDEAHFFDDVQLTKFLDAVRRLRPTAAVCVAGLDHDYRQLPFPVCIASFLRLLIYLYWCCRGCLMG